MDIYCVPGTILRNHSKEQDKQVSGLHGAYSLLEEKGGTGENIKLEKTKEYSFFWIFFNIQRFY